MLVKFANLLFSNDLRLEPSFDNISSDIFNAIDEEVFKVALSNNFIYIFRFFLPQVIPEPFGSKFFLFNCLVVICFQGLDIIKDFEFHVVLTHFRFKDQIDKLLKLNVF